MSSAVIPGYLNSVVENTTPSRLDMTYNLTLANIVPATSAFTVLVNSSIRPVIAVAISGTKVLLTLTSPVGSGDAVTFAYTKPSTNPLQTAAGGQAASISAQNVTNNVVAVIPGYLNSVVENTTPSRLDMTYNLTLANIVPATSAFTVLVNSSIRSVTAIAISGTKVLLTLASPVGSGDAVTVAYTKPSTNPLQTAAGGQAASIIAQSVINNVNKPPVIAITSPTKSLAFVAPATITIEVTASDSDGSISKVEFYNGNLKIGDGSPGSFYFIWKEVPEGTYSLTAVATDNLNAKTVSAAVVVVVEKSADAINQLPTVDITSPGKSKKYKNHDNIVITAQASDPDGTISKVELKNGGVTFAELTSAPYSFILEDIDTGKYVITAVAFDNLGASSSSSNLELTVAPFYDAYSEILNLYPNPNNGHFTVDIYSGFGDQNNKVTIVTLSGITIYSDIINEQESSKEFDLSEIPNGPYVLMVTSDDNIVATKKFIKK